MKNIILIGFMGSGKTSVGRNIAKKLEMKFMDMDETIEKETGKTINEIFVESGEDYFRGLETNMLNRLITAQEHVISTGGGIILKPENIKLLKKIGTVIFLHASFEQLVEHLKNDNQRPLLQGENYEERIKKLLNQREATYLSTADIILQTTGKNVDNIADEIMTLL